MGLQDEAVYRSIDKRMLFLGIGFVCWSLLGLRDVFRIWFDPVPWQWGLPLYIVVHVMLAVMLMRMAGLRLWSSLLCAGGLLIGEWNVLPMLFALTIWTFRGFV
jgi:hypothetical protein